MTMSNETEHQDHDLQGEAASPPPDPALTADGGTTPPAKRGGGPRTTEGKRASSMNARKHGLCSSSPVAAGESQEEFDLFLDGLHEQLAPVGTYEERCVVEIASEFQALDRFRRQTRDLIDLQVRKIDQPRPVSLLKSIKHDVQWSAFSRPLDADMTLRRLEFLPEDRELDEDVFADCLRAIAEVTGGTSSASAPDRADGHRSAGQLRRVIATASRAQDVTEPALIDAACALLDDVVALILGAEEKINGLKAEIMAEGERKARAHLPEYDEYDLLLRYKRAAERSLQEWINRLEASQRARSGDLPPPIRIQGLAS
jgi:hypothetical protein